MFGNVYPKCIGEKPTSVGKLPTPMVKHIPNMFGNMYPKCIGEKPTHVGKSPTQMVKHIPNLFGNMYPKRIVDSTTYFGHQPNFKKSDTNTIWAHVASSFFGYSPRIFFTVKVHDAYLLIKCLFKHFACFCCTRLSFQNQ